MINPQFWQGKRVFVTGHTGFKGSWLSIWLSSLGAQVCGFSLSPPTTPALFDEADVAQIMDSQSGDLRDSEAIACSVRAFQPDIVLHLAAQSLVRLSYQEPVTTYATNVMGSVHVLEAVRQCPGVRALVMVTTDKCYENREWDWGYRENEAMGGHDPYSNSKGCAELVTDAYRRSFFAGTETAVASARAGNVIGGGDWAVDRLVPDILRAFGGGEPAILRNPLSVRPWQHVLEPLSAYLLLAERLYTQGQEVAQAWNFGPFEEDARPVEWIAHCMSQAWGQGATWVLDESSSHPHEATYLKLDISRARSRLGWTPTWALGETLGRIVQWHKAWMAGEDTRGLCLEEITRFSQTMGASSVVEP